MSKTTGFEISQETRINQVLHLAADVRTDIRPAGSRITGKLAIHPATKRQQFIQQAGKLQAVAAYFVTHPVTECLKSGFHPGYR